jgi:hypothetical protein
MSESASEDKNKKSILTAEEIRKKFEQELTESQDEFLKIFDPKFLAYQPQRKSGSGCFKCGRKGHNAKDCFYDKDKMACFKCREKGHYPRDCDVDNRKCFQCNEKGHLKYECPQNDSD